MYIHQQPDWPHLTWRDEKLTSKVARVRQLQGQLHDRLESLDPPLLQEMVLGALTCLVMKSSQTKDPTLNPRKVYSSIAYRLGWDVGTPAFANPNVPGIVDVMLDATQNYSQPLSVNRLLNWHSELFSSEVSRAASIKVGDWRDDSSDPKQVVLHRPVGRPAVVDYEAPAAASIKQEMEMFLEWFNGPDGSDMVLKAGLAHLKFVAIHPFDKGNGRIAWAIREMALARFDASHLRSYSMAPQIRLDEKRYNEILKRTGEGTTDVTEWLSWFVECLDRSLECANETVHRKMRKVRLRACLSSSRINETHRKALERYIDDGKNQFSKKSWGRITDQRKDFDLPELNELVDLGLLVPLPCETKNAKYKIVGIS